MTKAGSIQLSKLARIDSRLAEISAEQGSLIAARAKILQEMADGDVVMETGRKAPRQHRPEIEPPTELDAMRARSALNTLERRRRLAR